MPDLWFPGAVRIPPTNSQKQGLTMMGSGERFFTWHTYEVDPNRLSAEVGARALNAAGTTPTFCFNPLSGVMAQMLPANKGGYTLRNLWGGVDTNFRGTIHMQVEVIAYAAQPFTSYMTPAAWATLARFMDWLDTWGIPRVFPAGQPLGSYDAAHKRIAPAASGHYGHSQWREQDHWDPGAIDIRRILSAGAAAAVVPTEETFALQRLLVSRGYLSKADVDGILGSKTKNAVKKYQQTLAHLGLLQPDDVDGAFGPTTAAADKEYTMITEQLKDIQKQLNTILDTLEKNFNVQLRGETPRALGTTKKSMPLADVLASAATAARRTELILNDGMRPSTARVRDYMSGRTNVKPGSLEDLQSAEADATDDGTVSK